MELTKYLLTTKQHVFNIWEYNRILWGSRKLFPKSFVKKYTIPHGDKFPLVWCSIMNQRLKSRRFNLYTFYMPKREELNCIKNEKIKRSQIQCQMGEAWPPYISQVPCGRRPVKGDIIETLLLAWWRFGCVKIPVLLNCGKITLAFASTLIFFVSSLFAKPVFPYMYNWSR